MTINNEVKDRVCGFKNQYRALKKCCNGVMVMPRKVIPMKC